jgi:hypothetical protein
MLSPGNAACRFRVGVTGASHARKNPQEPQQAAGDFLICDQLLCLGFVRRFEGGATINCASRLRAFDAFDVNHFRLLIELASHLHRLALERLGAICVVQLENCAR